MSISSVPCRRSSLSSERRGIGAIVECLPTMVDALPTQHRGGKFRCVRRYGDHDPVLGQIAETIMEAIPYDTRSSPEQRHVDFGDLLPLVVIGGGFSFVGAVLYGSWMLGRYRGREETTPLMLQTLESRLSRLEQATMQAAASIDRLEA